ncbi:GGDEF domain-containing protein [Oligoflexaceae bacterium]|nr:GGDEF domain-containing protein [Oligoflexaceae bacterium]
MTENDKTLQIKKNRAWQYAKWGAFFGLGSPLGWAIIDFVFDLNTHHAFLFYYLVFGTSVSFAIFGAFLGRKIDDVEKLSRTDQLSHLYNQTTFLEWSAKLYDHCVRSSQPCTLVIIDIDWFKQINDDYSHIFGNTVIEDISKIIAAEARSSDIAARFGGDEFSLFLPNTTGKKASILTERIRLKIAALQYSGKESSAKISVSAGLADSSESQTTFADLLERADQALYQTKESGRNGFTLWSA